MTRRVAADEGGGSVPPGELDGGEVPNALLPEGFASALDTPPSPPAHPRPAATVVLLREGAEALEVLLLRRSRSAGFVPGAWVFPGGRVEPVDADPRALSRTVGLTPGAAALRLGIPEGARPPAIAYYLAAVREAFEETGLWPGADLPDDLVPLQSRRRSLLAGTLGFPELLEELGLKVPGHLLEYIAHWVTPEAEPRRYDTRFFAAAVPQGVEVRVDAEEITGARWLSPVRALEEHRRGGLPMVFPTLHTLTMLADLRERTPEGALRQLRGRAVPRILPRLVRTPTGVGLRIPVPEGGSSPPDASPP